MDIIDAPDGTPASRLCFGAMQFGGTADEAASAAMFDACRAAGVTMFDTAHAYTDGRSEEILGRLAGPGRDGLVIASKAAFAHGASAANVRASLDDSRRRLGMEVIDLYYMHRWDAETPLEETFEALARAREAGAIRYVGVSNYAAWQVMKAQAAAATFGIRVDAIQPMLNVVKRQAEVEILPMAADQDVAAFPYSPLGGGLLTGKYAGGGEGRLTRDDMYARRYRPAWMHEAAAGLAAMAGEMGVEPATLAVAWAMGRPGVTAPIVSARSAAQLAPSLAALDVTLDADALARIDALSPAPPPATDRLEEVAS